MTGSRWRRVGVILAVVLLLTVSLVPVASANGQAAPALAPRVHVVRPGETLSSIARMYGVDVYELARVNRIFNLNWIFVGQRLTIPDGGPGPGPAPTYYVVKRGDTLAIIAWRYGTTVAALMQCNNIANPNRIYAGQTLRICGGYPPPPPPPPPGPTPVPIGWNAQYWNNRDLSGAAVVQRSEANLDYNWGWNPPAPGVYNVNWSGRWTRTFYMTAGAYRITAKVDDGVRVYIDGVLVIDSWQVQAVTTIQRDALIQTSGNHTFTVEYFQAEGVAELHVFSQKL
jgi:LysM repeat protein